MDTILKKIDWSMINDHLDGFLFDDATIF